MLVTPGVPPMPLMADGSGIAGHTLVLPPSPSLVGLTFYVQGGVMDGATLRGSNALEVVICP